MMLHAPGFMNRIGARLRLLENTLRNLLKPTTVGVVIAAAALLWAGCSPEKHYKTLSIFFDGVPDPNAKTSTAKAAAASGNKLGAPGRQGGPIASIHKPFAEENCTACHAQATQIFASAMDANVCLNCHQKVLDAYPVMHGPVIGKACLWCHQPHESPSPWLLKTQAATLCTQCHERESLTQHSEGHRSESASCLDCHTGHGGHALPFLRADASTQPTKAQ
jgi:predicted CXXCH cytochrome family protein